MGSERLRASESKLERFVQLHARGNGDSGGAKPKAKVERAPRFL